MFRRRDRPQVSEDLAADHAAFLRVVSLVEEAKSSLVAAAPTGRPARVSLAEALAGFEGGLAAARRAMDGWQPDRNRGPWEACRSAIDESRRLAERLRLEASPEGYEEVVALIDELIEPLDAFSAAAAWLRRVGQAEF